MHGTYFTVNGRGHRHIADKCFFDTKTSAMNRHDIFPSLHSSRFRQTRFNVEFTRPEFLRMLGRRAAHRRLTMPPPFTENKRYRMKPGGFGDVVNRKVDSVYQTDAVFNLIGGVQGRLNRALPTTKQYRVRRCPKEFLLRSSRAHPV
jgi:hypothetical protein